jgi:hypothetical protein
MKYKDLDSCLKEWETATAQEAWDKGHDFFRQVEMPGLYRGALENVRRPLLTMWPRHFLNDEYHPALNEEEIAILKFYQCFYQFIDWFEIHFKIYHIDSRGRIVYKGIPNYISFDDSNDTFEKFIKFWT